MNLLFWNMNEKVLPDELRALVAAHDVDVLILAECIMPDVQILEAVNSGSGRTFALPFSFGPSDRLRFYTRFEPRTLKPRADIGGVSVRHLTPPIGQDVILVAVHLPSKLHCSDMDYAYLAARMSEVIEEAETEIGHDRTVVIGDFNMSPFEAGLVSADGLHAVMDRYTAAKLTRTVQGRQRKFFFNPMWSRLGDASVGPPGTFYYRNTSQVAYFWHTFDQVLLRPSLLDSFRDEFLEVITEANGTTLLNNRGRPDRARFSDHLPLFLRLVTERITDGK